VFAHEDPQSLGRLIGLGVGGSFSGCAWAGFEQSLVGLAEIGTDRKQLVHFDRTAVGGPFDVDGSGDAEDVTHDLDRVRVAHPSGLAGGSSRRKSCYTSQMNELQHSAIKRIGVYFNQMERMGLSPFERAGRMLELLSGGAELQGDQYHRYVVTVLPPDPDTVPQTVPQ